MTHRDPNPEKAPCLSKAPSSARNSTPGGTGRPPRGLQTTLLISAIASLITALTGVAVLLLDHF
jgi:hypothetical protein